MIVLLVSFLALVSKTLACSIVTLHHTDSTLDGILFTALPYLEHIACHSSGRSCYIGKDSDGEDIYLYHTILMGPGFRGTGRWVMSSMGSGIDGTIIYANSFSVAPQLIQAVSDGTNWIIKDGGADDMIYFQCDETTEASSTPRNVDETVYVDIAGPGWELSGFYVQVGSTGDPIFSRVKVEGELHLFLFKLNGKWIIGEEPGVDAVHAFVDEPYAKVPSQIQTKEWLLSARNMETDESWIRVHVDVLSGSSSEDGAKNVYDVLREHRSLKYFSLKQPFGRLRNEMVIPYIGLGTGGIFLEDLTRVLTHAFLEGYRMLDLAREYGNEHIVRHVLDYPEHFQDANMPVRRELFLISKVWPTFLGFTPTTNEVLTTNAMLQSAYVDMHMLHWPSCDRSVSWMHCEDTVEPGATWHDSWRALERAYSEGRVMSIGVSNFNADQLAQLSEMATVLPHAVQNHGQPGKMDEQVRAWCTEHNSFYMPYAAGRNIKHLSEAMLTATVKIASNHGVSPNAVTSRFFLQTGAVVIPRSTKREHLRENMAIRSWVLTVEEMESLGWIIENDDEDL
jgi:diketogulonate reductase-like aldo/keto reductase